VNIEYPYFNFKLIDELDIGPVIYRLYDNKIFHAIIKKGEKITMDMALNGVDFLNKNGGGSFYNIYEFSSFSEMEPELREWASQPNENGYTYVDAIVISNLAQKLIANFYLKFNKPPRPTKIFYDSDKAVEWILIQKKQFEN
jgi:hypothetical protein